MASGWTRALGRGALAAVIAWHTASRAQEALDPQAAVDLAIARSPDVATATAALDAARGARSAARLFLYNPQANLQYDKDQDYLVIQAYAPFSLSGEGWFARAAARHQVDAAESALARSRFEVAAAVRLAWADAASASARADLAEDLATSAGRAVSAMRRRFELGDAAELDVRLVELARVQAEVAMLEADTAASTALAQLAQLVRQPLTPEQVRGDPLAAAPQPTTTTDGERSDLVAARETLKQAEAELGRARAAAVPPFWLGVDYEKSGPDVILGPYLQWDFPIFNRNQVARGDATGRRRQAEAQLGSKVAQVVVERQSARARYARAEAALANAGPDIEAIARAALDQVTAGIAAGEFDLATALTLRNQVLIGLDAVFRLRRAVVGARIDLLLALEDPALLGQAP